MRKLNVSGFLLVSVIVALMVSSVGMWTPDTAQSQDVIYFGQVMPFSGFFQPIDVDRYNGVELGIIDLNEKGGLLGRQVELLRYDMKSEPPLGANGAVELIAKGAVALQVPSDYDIGGPAALIAQSNKVLAFAGAADIKFGPAGIGEFAFSMAVSTAGESAQLAEWGYKEKGWRSAYILLDNTLEFTKSIARFFKIRWIELAGEEGLVGEDQFLNSDTSIASQITRLKSLPKQPDVIYFVSYPPGGASAIRQIRAAGISTPLLSCEGMDGEYWLGAVPDLSNFYVATYGSIYGDDSDPKINAYFKKHAAKFGQPATSWGTEGYSIVEAWARAVERAGTTDGEAVRKQLEKFDNEPLTVGPTSYSERYHISLNRPMSLLELQSGKYRFVTKMKAEKVPEP